MQHLQLTLIWFKVSETLLGIETGKKRIAICGLAGFKVSETLLGIETYSRTMYEYVFERFKVSETLLGIETMKYRDDLLLPIEIQSLRNPFRDWNLQHGTSQ